MKNCKKSTITPAEGPARNRNQAPYGAIETANKPLPETWQGVIDQGQLKVGLEPNRWPEDYGHQQSLCHGIPIGFGLRNF